MRCPNCKKKLKLGKQMGEWDKAYGDEIEDWALVAIYCPYCDEGVGSVEINVALFDEFTPDKGPFRGKTIIMPNLTKKSKKHET